MSTEAEWCAFDGCTAWCNNTCFNTCTQYCGDSCWDACSGSCGDACEGCTGCGSGCADGCFSTCYSTCQNDCNYDCFTTCSGKCDACTNKCTGHCDNGCTATNMATVYDALGGDIILNAIIYASDVKEIYDCIIRELNRRGLGVTTTTITAGTSMTATPIEDIDTNCRTAGYTTSETFARPTAAQMQRYVTYIKELYEKIVVP